MKQSKKDVRSGQDAQQKLKKLWENLCYVGALAYKLRSVLLSIPVAVGAIALAVRNMANLPEQVGLNLQATGEFAQMISREMAVTGPLALTAACLFLMFCSRKASYAWSISVFTLALPILLLISNLYPA